MFLHEIDFVLGKGLDVVVVAGKKAPINRLPVLGWDRPIFSGRIKNFPPPLEIFIVGENLFGIGKKEDSLKASKNNAHDP